MGQVQNKYHISDDGKVYKVNDDGSFTSMGNVENLANTSENNKRNAPNESQTSFEQKDDKESIWWKKEGLWVKVLFCVVCLLNIAQIIEIYSIYYYGTYIYYGEYFRLSLLIATLAGILVQIALYIHYKYLCNRTVILSKPNGEKPGTLGCILGIGELFIGKWRKSEETYVGYTFFILGMPLFPTGCYRYRIVKSDGTKITYNIYGSEKWSGKELFCLYAYCYGSLVWFMSAFMYFLFSY